MVKLYYDETTGQAGVQLFGDYFYDLLAVIRDASAFSFQDSWNFNKRQISKVFVGDACHIKRLITELSEIEAIEVPPWVNSLTEVAKQRITENSTEFFRRNSIPECFVLPVWAEYQLIDIKRAIRQTRFLFGWEMGLGKSYASITALNHYFKDKTVDRLMVLAPTSSIYNFRRELLRFNSFGLKPEDIYIADKNNRKPFEEDHMVVMMTYKTWVLLCQREYEATHKGKSISNPRKSVFDLSSWGTNRAIIADEIQALRNPGSKQTKWAILHSNFFRVRFGLSGTPAPNRVEQWHGPLRFIDPTILPPYHEWLPTIAQIGNRFSRFAISHYYPSAISSFSEFISRWVSRRYKSELPDLPPLINDSKFIPMNKKHTKLYQTFISYDLKKMVEDSSTHELVPRKVRDRFPYLLQAVDNPCLLKGKIDPLKNPTLSRLIDEWTFEDHSGFEYLKDFLEEWIDDEDRKVIVWSGHPLTLTQLSESFKQYNPIVISGETKTPKGMTDAQYRDQLVETFKSDKKHKVLFASYLVLDSAVNIVEATRAIFFDRSWDLEHTIQAMARNHRIGSVETVIITSLVCDMSLQVLLDYDFNRKSIYNNKFFELDSLSAEDYKMLFEGTLPDKLQQIKDESSGH